MGTGHDGVEIRETRPLEALKIAFGVLALRVHDRPVYQSIVLSEGWGGQEVMISVESEMVVVRLDQQGQWRGCAGVLAEARDSS